jgi:hypothetical protein
MSRISPIKKLVPLSLARLFAAYYGFWGLVVGCTYMVQLKEDWPAPVGVWTLFYFAKINLTLHPEANLISKVGDLFWLAFYYSLTGWLSGLATAAIYNVCSGFLGLQVNATIEDDPAMPQSDS